MTKITVLNESNTLFLIVDIQEKLLNAVFNKDTVEKNASILSKTSSLLNIPVIVTEQYPQGLGETIASVKSNLIITAEYYTKTSFNALVDENLLENIKQKKCKNIVLFGIETHICVYQTACALMELGYNVTILANACGSRSEYEYNMAIEQLRTSGADIKTCEMVVFELLKTAKHPNFKEIQNLIK